LALIGVAGLALFSPLVGAGSAATALSGLPSSLAGTGTGLSGPVFVTRIYFGGQRIILPVAVIIVGGCAMAPARALLEQVGATVVWDGQRVLSVKSGSKTIRLGLGETTAQIDGQIVTLAVAPFMWRSRVMVPVRLLTEALGLTLTWDESRRAILLQPTGGGQGGGPSPSGPTPTSPTLTLAFGGDTLLGYRIADLIRDRGADYPWGGVSDILSGADLALVNLECCVSVRGTPQDKKWTFRADPVAVTGLQNAGVDIVSLANNHVLDFGVEAFVDTLAYLDKAGVARVGAGLNVNEAARPIILESKGFKIGYLSATEIYLEDWLATETRPGVWTTHSSIKIIEAVEALRPQVDCVVVALHWGVEYEPYPYPYQRQLARSLIDAGASIIIGHHPHVLQGLETYRGGLIAYSLGNFVFTYKTRESQNSGILLVTLDKAGLAGARFLPVFTNYGRPVLETGADYDQILVNLNTWSEDWETFLDPDGYIMMP
jgi:poly-gamma-glutamate capsule biosynthesis protein CapA/YwtB (metallophosphatase superfamily)